MEQRELEALRAEAEAPGRQPVVVRSDALLQLLDLADHALAAQMGLPIAPKLNIRVVNGPVAKLEGDWEAEIREVEYTVSVEHVVGARIRLDMNRLAR